MKLMKYGLPPLLLLSILSVMDVQGQERERNHNFFYVGLKPMMTLWKGIGQPHDIPDVGVDMAFQLNLHKNLPLDIILENDFFRHDDEIRVYRIGFALLPAYRFELGEEKYLSVGPKLRLVKQFASGVTDVKMENPPEVKAVSKWHFNIQPTIEYSGYLDEEYKYKGAVGLFLDLNNLGNSINKLQHNNEAIYGHITTVQLGINAKLYFR